MLWLIFVSPHLTFRHCWAQQPDLQWLHRKGTNISFLFCCKRIPFGFVLHLIKLVALEIHWTLSFFLITLLSVLQLKELLNYYYPIEIDSSRPVEEKIPLMVEWWVSNRSMILLSSLYGTVVCSLTILHLSQVDQSPQAPGGWED